MARKFEKNYRIRETDDVLEKSNRFLQDVDQRLDAIEQIADLFRAGNRADVDALIEAINLTISIRSAEIQALIDEQAAGFTPDRITETPLKRFTSDLEISALVDALAAPVLDLPTKAALFSPALVGSPTAPTPAPGNDSTLLATTAFVRTAITALVSSAPGQLDTLAELAAALGNDADFSSTVLTAIGGKQPASALLSSLAGVAAASNKLFYLTGPSSIGLTDLSPFFRTLMDDANATAIFATLGLIPVANIPPTLTPDKAFRRGNVLGAVEQSGGVPTGAIVERGSNVNGHYVRFADGMQICRVITVYDSVLAAGTGWDGVWTLPAAMASGSWTPIVSMRGIGTGGATQEIARYVAGAMTQSGSATSGVWGIFNRHTSGITARVDLTAIGWWY